MKERSHLTLSLVLGLVGMFVTLFVFGETTYTPTKPTRAKIVTPSGVTETDNLTKFRCVGAGTLRQSKTTLIITTDNRCDISFGDTTNQPSPPIIEDPIVIDPVVVEPTEAMQATVKPFRNMINGYSHNDKLAEMFALMPMVFDSLSFADTNLLAKWHGTTTDSYIRRNKLPKIQGMTKEIWNSTMQSMTNDVLGMAVRPVTKEDESKAVELYQALEWAAKQEIVKQ